MVAIDPRLEKALEEATSQSGQPKQLFKRLNSWLENLLEGNETLVDRDSVHKHIELIYESIITDTSRESKE